MNDTTEILKAARQLIEKREDWWDGRTPQSSPLGLCALQAVSVARSRYQSKAGLGGWFALDVLFSALPPGAMAGGDCDIARYNDTHSHEDVLALFDRAIAATEVNE